MNSTSASINDFSANKPSDDIIHLQELTICAGELDDLIEPDGENFALALIEDLTVEVPIDFAQSTMWPMVGKRIWLAVVKGQIRAEVMSA
jgi:hypothetical protein